MSQHISKLFINVGKNIHNLPKNRSFCRSSMTNARSLVYNGYGEPVEILNLTNTPDVKPGDNQVAVKWLLSPVNPADINTLQGKYPSRPTLPAVAGNEGVGEILEVGSGVKDLNVGDSIVPNANNIGTWQTRGVYDADYVLKIPKGIDKVEASMLNVNPCTAYRLLKDFVKLSPGDTIIQNGGNSAVGQLVIQLCKAWNYKSVNIVRDRPDINDLKSHLKNMGADEVLTDTELRTTDLFKSKKLPAPKLAFNCVCGQTTVEVLRHVASNGTMVTYGAMSREPLIVPASALIFKNITIKGFWMTAWTKENTKSKERMDMLDDLAQLFNAKKLQAPPHEIVPLSEYKKAVGNAMRSDGMTTVKYILDLTA